MTRQVALALRELYFAKLARVALGVVIAAGGATGSALWLGASFSHAWKIGVIAGVVALIVALMLWYVPSRDVSVFEKAKANDAERQEKLAELRLTSRTSVTQALGGVLLIVTLALTAYQANGARKAADAAGEAANENIRIARDAQLTERYARAIDQLGATSGEEGKRKAAVDVRAGALVALRRIGNDSDEDTGPALFTVATYVRGNLPKEKYRLRRAARADRARRRFTARHLREGAPPLPSWVAAENACHGWREERRINVRTDLVVALRYVLPRLGEKWLQKSSSRVGGLRFTNFSSLNLSELELAGLDLDGSTFNDANLARSTFRGVKLPDADFRNACLIRVDFSDPNNAFVRLKLRGANFYLAHVPKEFFKRATTDCFIEGPITVDGKLYNWIDPLRFGAKPDASRCWPGQRGRKGF